MESSTKEEPIEPTIIPVVMQSPTNENLNTVLEISKDEDSENQELQSEEPVPKVSNEARHSVGSYIVPHRERISRISGSLGVGGGRSHRPSQSEKPLAKSQSEIQVNTTNSLSVSQNSKNSLMTYSSSGTFYDHSRKKMDVRLPPKPVQSSSGKDTTDFRQMEQGLLQLLEDFHCGKLEGFGSNCTFEKMENVREQQEKLARLHFDLNAQQEMCGYVKNVQHTDEGIQVAKGNLAQLIENLQQLSQSIEQLQSGSPTTENEKQLRGN
ncbi:hypothetical protein JTE90_011909 [Oedothorax gibbosus]|uniref:Coiled-coil domain containing 28A n=1 Tax=Oedothorax gibbosus TaxID=931172 RepID=A0AAV6V080_9ARAC|nr:hypothetical protein JTE90_011909 [Oedothorax gibbosus]